MKCFALAALLVGSAAAVKKVAPADDLPSTRFTNPDHVDVPHPNPGATQCSHTQCMMVEVPTKYGNHEIMRVIHSNVEARCARFQTVSRNDGLDNHVEDASKKVHCGRVKTWVVDTNKKTSKGHPLMHHEGGHWSYDGPCECHKAGTHPNGNGGMVEMHPTEAPAVTAAPVVPGVTEIATTVIGTKLKLPGVTVAAFTAEAQEGVTVAIARVTGVHREQVALVNIVASNGRRLAEAAGGVTFDVILTIKNDQAAGDKAMEKIESLSTVTSANVAEREHFSDVMAEEMVKAVKASPAPPSAAVIATLAGVVVAVEEAPIADTTTVKAGCYVKAHSCPNHKWASGTWNWHSHGTARGKAYCLSDADNHHLACGGDVTDPWSQKWVDNTGESVVTYPSPGCYWKLTTCPNHPGWLTTPANGGSSTNWKKHNIDDRKRCVGSAWSHHVLCGLPETEVSATMFIGDENSDDATKATTHAVSCGVHQEVQLPAVAVSMSSTFGSFSAQKCIDGDITSRSGMCHSKKEKAWIKIDMGANYRTSSVVITNRKDCCQGRFDDHIVETSTDDETWTQCFRGVLPHTSGAFTEKCAAEARYVRARMINPEYLNLQEVQVRGTPLCGVSHKPHLSKAAPASSATFVPPTNTFVDIPDGANTQGKCNTCSKSFNGDEKACLAAAVKLYGSKVTAKRAGLVAGSWNHVPSGCSVQSGGDWAAHFNRNAAPTNVDSTYTVVRPPYTTVVTSPIASTNAIRLMNTQATLNDGWYRVTEITAKDADGNVLMPAGARSDTYHGAWRSSKWAPELFDDDKAWGNDRAIHFKEYATVWFDQPVAIGSLTMVQLERNGKYAQSGFKWQAYDGTFVDAGEPMSEKCCLAAGVAKFGRKVKVSRSGLVAGSWNHVPSGCSVQSGGDWAVHFNRNTAPTNVHSTYTTVLGTCPNIPDEQMCLRTAVKKFGSKVTAKRSTLVAGSWNHVPSGCSVQSGGDWAVHYNRRTGKVGDNTYTSVFA